MQEQEHTPGPWRVVQQKWTTFWGREAESPSVITEYDHPQLKGPVVIVGVGRRAGPKGEDDTHVCLREQDATLIAAAPDLLEALQKLDLMITDWAKDQGFPVESSACWRVVRAALAKALPAPPAQGGDKTEDTLDA